MWPSHGRGTTSVRKETHKDSDYRVFLSRRNQISSFLLSEFPFRVASVVNSLVELVIMDPASLSFAVVDMFLTCCKGYKFLSDTKNATSDAQDAARRIAMEYYVLGNWGSHFELDANRPRQPIPKKLKFSLTNDHARRGVFSALCTISATFTDVKALDRKYGIVCKSQWKGDRVSSVSIPLAHLVDAILLVYYMNVPVY